MEFNGMFDMFDDDVEVLEIINEGVPRKIYERANLFDSLDDLTFFKRFRLTKPTVLEVLEMIEEHLEFPTDRNQAVSPINQLLTTLRFYATDGHFSIVADCMGMHVSTVCRIIKRVSKAIAGLYKRVIKMPRTEEEIKKNQRDFYQIAMFPRIIGAIDGTHVKIQSPDREDAEVFRNRKEYFSINVQAVCNADLEFLDIVAEWPGSSHDATIFGSCRQKRKFEDGTYPNSLLLGDSGYYLRPYLLTPLLNPITEEEQLYNEAHIRTRNVIERTFGVWKRRFPVLAYGCRLQLNTVLTIIIACGVLHNIARRMQEEDPPIAEYIDEDVLEVLIAAGDIPNIPLSEREINNCAANRNRNLGVQMRNNFIHNYFNIIRLNR